MFKKGKNKYQHELTSLEWSSIIIGNQSPIDIANRIKNNKYPLWIKTLLTYSSPKDSLLELGSGSGELSAILGLYGRKVSLMDYSENSIAFTRGLFGELGIDAEFHVCDLLRGIPFPDNSVDWVWSSGLLEHFTDDEIDKIMADSVRVCNKGVMSLVPNANSLFYRIGKYKMEKDRTWQYGREIPKYSMKPHFDRAGLKNTVEYSVGPYHSLGFWGKGDKEIKGFYDSLSHEELQSLNQGYLLFTYGEK